MSRTASPRAPRDSVCIITILTTPPRPRAARVLSGREIWLDLAQDGFLAPSADDAGLLLTVLEHDQGGDAHHAEPSGGLGIVVHVHLDGLDAPGFVPGDLLDDRGDHVTRHAPLGPEVHEHGPVRGEDLALEALVVHLYDVIGHSAVPPQRCRQAQRPKP